MPIARNTRGRKSAFSPRPGRRPRSAASSRVAFGRGRIQSIGAALRDLGNITACAGGHHRKNAPRVLEFRGEDAGPREPTPYGTNGIITRAGVAAGRPPMTGSIDLRGRTRISWRPTVSPTNWRTMMALAEHWPASTRRARPMTNFSRVKPHIEADDTLIGSDGSRPIRIGRVPDLPGRRPEARMIYRCRLTTIGQRRPARSSNTGWNHTTFAGRSRSIRRSLYLAGELTDSPSTWT